MIEFKRLKIKNFKCYKEADLDLSIIDSAVILGQFDDNSAISNGSGKSSIFEAFDYILFDEYKSSSINKIVRHGESIAELELELAVDGRDYKIFKKRSNKSNTTEVSLFIWNGKWIASDAKTNTQTNAAIKTLLGINYDSWKHSVLFSQGQISGLANATSHQRKLLLKEPLQLAVYSQFEKEAKAKLNVSESNLKVLKAQSEDLGSPEQDIEQLNKTIEQTQLELLTLIKEQDDLQKLTNLKKMNVFELEKILNSSSVETANEIKKIDAELIDKKRKLESLKVKLVDSHAKIEKNKQSLSDKIKVISDLRDQKEALENSFTRSDNDINVDIKRASEIENKGRTYLASLRAKYDRLSKNLPDVAECDSCFNALTPEYKAKVEADNKVKAIDIMEKIEESDAKLKSVLDKKKKLESDLRIFYKVKADIANLQNKLSVEESQVKQFQNLIIELNEMMSELNRWVKSNSDSIDQLQQRKDELEKLSQTNDVEDVTKKLILLKKELDQTENEIKLKIAQNAHKNTTIGIYHERLNSREKDLIRKQQIKSQIELEEEDVKNKKLVISAFSAGGIPTFIINTILDDLQIEANKILNQIRPQLDLQFLINDDKDSLDLLFRDNGIEIEYGLLSGGQKVFISFALQLGLSMVIQKRLGVEVKLLLLDEVDQPFDRSGQESFVQIVKSLQSQFKILTITHNDRLKDKFSNAIIVEKSIDGSTAKVVRGQ